MKGSQTLIVLQLLAHRATGSYDILEKLFEREYAGTYRQETEEHGRAAAIKKMRTRYHNFLYKLKRGGLIVPNKHVNALGTQFAISEKGRVALMRLQGRISFPDKKSYVKEDGAGITIVTFDIPEKERRKRNWFRGVLKHLGFTMMNRSVWLGKTRLPIELLRDLQGMELMRHIEAFQVSRVGNLKKLSISGR